MLKLREESFKPSFDKICQYTQPLFTRDQALNATTLIVKLGT